MDSEPLSYFFECYFHQDWRDDYSSSFDVLLDFCQSEPELKEELKQQFLELIEQGYALSDYFVHELGGNFKTEREGFTAVEWLNIAVSKMV